MVSSRRARPATATGSGPLARGRFWQPVAERLPPCEKILVDYPGAGNIPHSPSVRSFDDLVSLATSHMERPVDIVAQSMGGVVAVQAALARPQAVRRLVLTATSGGVDFKAFTHHEWRDEYRQAFPGAAGGSRRPVST